MASLRSILRFLPASSRASRSSQVLAAAANHTPLTRPAFHSNSPLTPLRPWLSQGLIRHNSTAAVTSNNNVSQETAKDTSSRPLYQLTFTCKPCSTRSSHRITRHGYHKGTVLITCPECKNRHIISDHLEIFSDTAMTIEDIMKEKGQLVRRGTLGPDGDVEFWDDGKSKVGA